MNVLPKLSIIIPCYNEADFIATVLKSILAQDYPLHLMEILLVDGGSTDGTALIIKTFAKKHPQIFLLHNPKKFVPHAMNLGLEKAKGAIIIRLDAHADYPVDYVSTCVYWSQKTGADNVGGIWRTKARTNTTKAKAIVEVLSHPVGVGNASFRTGVLKPTEVDTVPFGCFPKSVFAKYGTYDERLHRNQDIELNKRIRRAGGKILLVPEISCTYFARSTYSSLYKNNFANGKWVLLTAYFTQSLDSLSWRHFVPFLLVLYTCCATICTIFALFWKQPQWAIISLIPLFLYVTLLGLISFQIGIQKKQFRLIPHLFASFLTLHWSYGIGSFNGLFEIFRTTK